MDFVWPHRFALIFASPFVTTAGTSPANRAFPLWESNFRGGHLFQFQFGQFSSPCEYSPSRRFARVMEVIWSIVSGSWEYQSW